MSLTMPTLRDRTLRTLRDLVPDRERRAENPNTVSIVGSLTEAYRASECNVGK